MTDSSPDAIRMVTELVRMHQALQEISLPLDLEGVEATRKAREEMISQLEDYVIPRMMTIDAPLLTVVGGSTGAGKSTLVNSVVGTRVTAPGLLRPTTRSPVLVHHPDDAHWFGQDRLLPHLERVDHGTDDPHSLQLVASDRIKPGLAIIDAPDVDSVEEQNRLLAAELLAAGDLWLFVTSAARYADQVPWEFLKLAAERSTAVAVVLDRTPQDAVQTVATHLARMLAARGLKDSPLFIVNEGKVSEEGLLPADHVAEIRGWLDMLADDANARQAVVTQTLDGAVRALTFNVHKVADDAGSQPGAAEQLRLDAVAAYDAATGRVLEGSGDGSLLRGEALARWEELIGSGALLSSVEERGGRLRERMLGAIKGKPQQAERVAVAVESGLELLILEHAEAAADQAERAWQQSEAGRRLLAGDVADLGRASRALRSKAERAVSQWHGEIVEMIREAGRDQRTTARFLAYGVSGLGVVLMVVVLADRVALGATDPAAGTEPGDESHAGDGADGPDGPGGADGPALGQRVLDAVLGEQTARDLVARARASLETRVRALLGEELGRYTAVLDGVVIDEDAPARLRHAARRVDDVRWASLRRGRPDAPETALGH